MVEKGDSEACYRCHVTNEIREEFSKEAILTVSKLVIGLYEKLSGPLQNQILVIISRKI